ncbi:MAG: methylmalonyl Co-A mutase-associated GTPase MeaB [Myxococcales bacterium]|nr:MAG: methylmalonyl Co-A mutase-associated GTPase MeaB [Myxococcales bacterium]
MKQVYDVVKLAKGVLNNDRNALGRSITLVESTNPNHRNLAQELLAKLLAHTGKGYRVGITGVPGVGKSTFIEAFRMHLMEKDHRVAVLAIAPRSAVTGGSIMGDKTGMRKLANHDDAFIRPSPTPGALGGVARRTQETLLLCEAAGFDVVLIETVGVGQSETIVSEMVDFFLALMLPGAGDELQGIKRGLLEMVDMIAVNKADGENLNKAKLAASHYKGALRITQTHDNEWLPPVQLCSGLKGEGLDEIWQQILKHRKQLEERGQLSEKRKEQAIRWMWKLLDESLLELFRNHPDVSKAIPTIEKQVRNGQITPAAAAKQLLDVFKNH